MPKYIFHLLLFFQFDNFAQVSPIIADTLIDGNRFYGYKQNNQFIIKPEYSDANLFVENIALVKKNGYYKYINSEGEQIDSQQFVDARSFSEGFAEVKLSDGWSFINSSFKIIFEDRFESTKPFSEGIAAVKKTKWQFITKKNELVFQNEYDTVISSFENGLAIVGNYTDEYRFGIITKNGARLVPFAQKEIKRLTVDLFVAKTESNLFTIYNTKGQAIITEIDSVSKISDSLFLFEKQGYQNIFNETGKILYLQGFKSFDKGAIKLYPKWKVCDSTFKVFANFEADSFKMIGKHIVRCLNNKKQIVYPKIIGGFYTDIQLLDSTTFAIKSTSKWALMNIKSALLTNFEYDSVWLDDPFYKIKSTNKYGLLGTNGIGILEPTFKSFTIQNKSKRFLLQHSNWAGRYDAIHSGLIESTLYDSLSELSTTMILGHKNGYVYLLDDQLNRIDSMYFKEVRLLSDTLLLAIGQDSVYRRSFNSDSIFVRNMNVRYFLNDTLALVKVSDTTMGVYHFVSDSLYVFEADTTWRHPNMPNRLLTKKKDTLGLANIEGKILANYPRNFSFIGNEENGYLKVIAKRHYGFIDTNGRLLIATQYDSVLKVEAGYAAVKLRGKWGFVDLKEKLIVQPYYSKVGAFSNKKAPVWLSGLATLVDNTGLELFKPKYQYIEPSKNGNWITTKNNIFGFLHADSQEAFNPKFEKVNITKSGFYIVNLYGKMGILNQKLQIIKPFIEKEIRNITDTDFFIIRE